MIPYISSYAMFSPGRNWEQIRTTIAYNDRKVVIAGAHAGLSVGPDGGTSGSRGHSPDAKGAEYDSIIPADCERHI